MPIGQAIEAHLRRVGLMPPERFSFDASRSVFAMVQRCQGWAITTPLGLLDCEPLHSQLDIHPLPFPTLTRTISLVTRRDELGTLPAQLTALCTALLREQTHPAVRALAPWVDDALRVHDPRSSERAGLS